MLNKLEWKKIAYLSLGFLILEILSFSAFYNSSLSLVLFILFGIAFLFLSIKNLQIAVLVVFAELIIGSMGHMFFLEISSFKLGIRVLLWSLLMLVFLIKFLVKTFKNKDYQYWQRIKDYIFLKPLLILAFFVLTALISAFLNNNSLSAIFNDANSWLFFLLVFPSLAALDFKNEKFISNAKVFLMASILWLSFKSLFLLALFSHNLPIISLIYPWLRGTLTAEVTVSDFWPRVFMQSQIFSGTAFIFFFWLNSLKNNKFFSKENIIWLIISAFILSALIISFSRSFWVAFFPIIGLAFIYLWKIRGFKKMFKSFSWLSTSFLFSLVIIYFFSVVPLPGFSGANFGKGLSDRLSQNADEPALASRWALLPVLWEGIKEAPIFGHGFGAELSYQSEDPRVLEQTGTGFYTTTAFEWGYLDIWFKLGIFGFLAYLLFLFKIVYKSYKLKQLAGGLFFASGLALIFLLLVHFFTPYINHPLGISLIILVTCIIQGNEVYLIKIKENN